MTKQEIADLKGLDLQYSLLYKDSNKQPINYWDKIVDVKFTKNDVQFILEKHTPKTVGLGVLKTINQQLVTVSWEVGTLGVGEPSTAFIEIKRPNPVIPILVIK